MIGSKNKLKIGKKPGKGRTLRRRIKSGRNWPQKASSLKTGPTVRPDGSGDQPEVVFGLHTLREILRANTRPLLRIHVIRPDRQFSDLVQLARSKGIPVHIDPPERLDRLIRQGRHQGIVGVVGAKSYTQEEDLLDQALLSSTPALLVILDNIQDPQNLGAVLRTAEAAGVH